MNEVKGRGIIYKDQLILPEMKSYIASVERRI